MAGLLVGRAGPVQLPFISSASPAAFRCKTCRCGRPRLRNSSDAPRTPCYPDAIEPTDLTVQILREIRDEIRGTNKRVDETNRRIDETNRQITETNSRLDQTRDELGKRIVESELRTATAITELAGAVQDVRTLLQDRLDLRDRVTRCEEEIAEIKRKLG